MFDLEKSIAEWRMQMSAGIKNSSTLEELENHLREEIERQMKSGFNEEKAFEISVRQIGKVSALKTEFKKIREINTGKYMNASKLKSLGIILAFGAIIISILLQTFTNSFITFQHIGTLAAILFHWPFF